jgi:N12 class adenine-specific DNA methylase
MDNEHENTTFLAFHHYTYIADCLTPAQLQNSNHYTVVVRFSHFTGYRDFIAIYSEIDDL